MKIHSPSWGFISPTCNLSYQSTNITLWDSCLDVFIIRGETQVLPEWDLSALFHTSLLRWDALHTSEAHFSPRMTERLGWQDSQNPQVGQREYTSYKVYSYTSKCFNSLMVQTIWIISKEGTPQPLQAICPSSLPQRWLLFHFLHGILQSSGKSCPTHSSFFFFYFIYIFFFLWNHGII